MSEVPTTAHDTSAPDTDELDTLVASWRRHLRAQRMSPATLLTYTTAVRQLTGFLRANGMPTAVTAIRREHVESWITELLERWKPATAHNRYRAAHTFFGWLAEEGEIDTSPMARMKPPRLPEAPPPVLREAELRELFAACERDRSFVGRRDEAIIDARRHRHPVQRAAGAAPRRRRPRACGVARDRQGVAHARRRDRRPDRTCARQVPAAAREAQGGRPAMAVAGSTVSCASRGSAI